MRVQLLNFTFANFWCTAALLILGKECLYLFEGYVESSDGELIDARDAPEDLLSTLNSGNVDTIKYRSQRW